MTMPRGPELSSPGTHSSYHQHCRESLHKVAFRRGILTSGVHLAPTAWTLGPKGKQHVRAAGRGAGSEQAGVGSRCRGLSGEPEGEPLQGLLTHHFLQELPQGARRATQEESGLETSRIFL